MGEDSLNYQCPEMLSGTGYTDKHYSPWCFAVILYNLLVGKHPFDDECNFLVKEKILAIDYSMPKELSPEARDLFQKIFLRRHFKRLDLSDIEQHPFFTKNRIPAFLPESSMI